MNEPRSQSELYIVRRQTTDGSRMYNISYNPGDDLQHWIEDMASYVKSMDPIHLLSTGARPALRTLPALDMRAHLLGPGWTGHVAVLWALRMCRDLRRVLLKRARAICIAGTAQALDNGGCLMTDSRT